MRYMVVLGNHRLVRRLAKLERQGKIRIIRVVVIVEGGDGRALGAWAANYDVELVPHRRNPLLMLL